MNALQAAVRHVIICRSMRPLVLVAIFVAGFAAVAITHARADGPPALRCPHDGGSVWSETSTPHITLAADVAPARLAPLASELERARAEMVVIAPLVFLGQRTNLNGSVHVTAFRDRRALPALVQGDLDGVYLGGRVGLWDQGGPEIMRHELTHYVVRKVVGNVPRWLQEGIAEYLSSARFVEGRARVGDIPERIKEFGGRGTRAIAGAPIPKLSELLTAPDSDFDRTFGVHYVAAWTLVHLVNNERPEHRERFRDYLRALAGGVPPDEAWRAHLGPVQAALEQQYDEFLTSICRRGTFDTRTNLFDGVTIPSWSGTPSPPRAISDGDVHALWTAFDQAPDAERLVTARAALAHDVASVDLYYQLYLLERDRPDRAKSDLAGIAALRPDDERLLRVRLQQALDAHATRRQLVLLDTDAAKLARGCHDADGLATLATYWGARADLRRAFDFAKRSIDTDPACALCWATLTVVYIAYGQANDAERAFRHVLAQVDRRAPLPAPLTALASAVAKLRHARRP